MDKKVVLFFGFAFLFSSAGLVVADQVAPDFTLIDVDGLDFSLSDFKGRVVLLDFFATWCGTCRAEIPHLRSLHEEFGEDLVIISISTDPLSDTVEDLILFREERVMDWIVARDTEGVSWNYGVASIPTKVIVDQEGYVQHRHVGLTDELVLREEILEIMTTTTGDINGDDVVDIFDVVTVSIAFGSSPEGSNWNQAADLNSDDIVDIFDVVILANSFGS